jgi:WD40 repeat protein
MSASNTVPAPVVHVADTTVWTAESNTWIPRPDMSVDTEGLREDESDDIEIIRNDSVNRSALGGVMVAACSRRRRIVLILDLPSTELLCRIRIPEDPGFIVLDPPGSKLAISSDIDQLIRVIDLKRFTQILFNETGNNRANSVAFSSNGNLFVDGSYKVWDLSVLPRKKVRLARAFCGEDKHSWWCMNSFAFACNDRRVVGGHIAGFVVWNVDTGSQLWNAPMKIPKDNDDFIGECYIFAPGGNHALFVSKRREKLTIWNTEKRNSNSDIDNKVVDIHRYIESVDFGPMANNSAKLVMYVGTSKGRIVAIDVSTKRMTFIFAVDYYGLMGRIICVNYASNLLMTQTVGGVVIYGYRGDIFCKIRFGGDADTRSVKLSCSHDHVIL